MTRTKNAGMFGLLLLILLTGCDIVAPDDQYHLGPDSEIQLGVAQGAVRALTLPPSKVYPGYTHRAWLYIPAQYSGQTAIALMVFQDGGTFVSRDGPWRVPTVLDNLIQRKELPIMAAVFVEPGRSGHDDGLASEQRSFEYDTLSGQYAQFLLTEVLPEVRKSARSPTTPREEASLDLAAAVFARSPLRGRGPMLSARCSQPSAVLSISEAVAPTRN